MGNQAGLLSMREGGGRGGGEGRVAESRRAQAMEGQPNWVQRYNS